MTEDNPIPVLFEHCCKVYAAMLNEATTESVKTGDSSSEDETSIGAMVYTGHLTQLFQKLELAVPYYTTVMGALKDMGCVTQLRRGGGTSMSKWALHGMPSEATWTAAEARKPRRKTKKDSEYEALQQLCRDQNKRITLLEENQQVLATAIEQLSEKISG